MVGLGIDHEVALHAHEFGFWLFLAMGFHMQFDCYKQYLNGTNQSKIVQYAVMSTLMIHLFMCYIFTNKLELGVAGVGFATMITCALNMLFVVLWTWKMTPEAVSPIPKNPIESLRARHVKIYMGISVPSIVMLCADWWAYEGIVILAAFLSV